MEKDGFKAKVSFDGAEADEVIVKSDTEILAKWKFGLPPSGKEIAPKLWFDKTSTQERYYAKVDAKLLKELKITGATSGLECSFAGGCEF